MFPQWKPQVNSAAGMELRHLRYFVAVGEDLNFRKASSRLNISRPALSKQIKDLEEELSVRLLDRNTKSVRLTKAGEIFLKDSRLLLENAARAAIRAREAHVGYRGELRIGSAGIISSDFLPRTLKNFRQKYPEVEVTFVDMFPAEQIEALTAGTIDIAFAYGDDGHGGEMLDSLCVVHSSYALAVSRQHFLAERKSVALEELGTQSFLSVGNGGKSSHAFAISRIFAEEGLSGVSIRSINGFDSLVTLLSADDGVSLLPMVLDLRKQDIVLIPILPEKTSLDFHMWAVWKRDFTSIHIRHFIGMLETAAPHSGRR